MMKKISGLEVRRTDDRKGFGGEYFAVVLNKTLEKYGSLEYGVIVYEHPVFQENLAVPCKVASVDKYQIEVHSKKDSLKPDEIAIDQSIRNALGLRYAFDKDIDDDEEYPKVTLHRLNVPRFFVSRNRISEWLGHRYLYLRNCRAFVNDMEKDFCRVPSDAVGILGTIDGCNIWLECPVQIAGSDDYKLNSVCIKVYGANSEMLHTRRNDEKLEFIKFSETNKLTEVFKHKTDAEDGKFSRDQSKSILNKVKSLDERYPIRYQNPEMSLGLQNEPDIHPVYLDNSVRKELRTDLMQVARGRRDIWDLFFKEMVSVGALLLVALFAVTDLVLLYNIFDFFDATLRVLLILSLAIIISFTIVLLTIRNRIK